MKRLTGVLVGALLVSIALPLRADSRQDDINRIHASRLVFQQIMRAPDNAIPNELLESAKCIAIVPSEVKFAFILGGRYGKGLVTCRTSHGWSAPVFLMVGGGSFGFQIGGAATDLVLLFMHRQGAISLLDHDFKIGAGATAAAGPVGRHASASTGIAMRAEILTYSRSRGVFAGISLNGAIVKVDKSADEALYGRDSSRERILDGGVPVPQVARSLVSVIERDARAARS
jgi:SH3 domain-containing YSC84-like protein 1